MVLPSKNMRLIAWYAFKRKAYLVTDGNIRNALVGWTSKQQTKSKQITKVVLFFSIDAKIPVAIKAAKLPHFCEYFKVKSRSNRKLVA
jgi:hypothetical protein